MESSNGSTAQCLTTSAAATTTTTPSSVTISITSSSSSLSSSSATTSALPVPASTSAITCSTINAAAISSSCSGIVSAVTGSLPPSLTSAGLNTATAFHQTPLLQMLPLETVKQDDSNNLSLASGLSEGQRSLSAAPSASSSPIQSPPNKIFGRNANGTMVATSRPNNEAEIQLYRVLQKASLLAYYDTLLEMGGDDVQQLYEAGEEEFLEIMALVGMASKPLHVRRLQKALHEWALNPTQFQQPFTSNTVQYETPAKSTLNLYNPEFSRSPGPAARPKYPTFNPSTAFNPTPLVNTVTPTTSAAHLVSQIYSLPPLASQNPTNILIPSTPSTQERPKPLPTMVAVAGVSNTSHQVTSSSPQLTPVLSEMQVSRIALGAEKIASQLPQREPRAHTSKKRTSRELEQVIAMNESDPRRMEEIRKYSAIYGRFDCKRRPEKPLTLHEVCVNEAAAQLCRLVPALLTRRDELFPLARQIVKDAGFGHSASIARYGNLLSKMVNNQTTTSQMCFATAMLESEMSETNSTPKRPRVASSDASLSTLDSNRDSMEDPRYNLFAMYQKFAAKPSFDLSDIAKFTLNKASDFDDPDQESRFSFSNSSSPSIPNNGAEDDRNANSFDKMLLKSSDCVNNNSLELSNAIATSSTQSPSDHMMGRVQGKTTRPLSGDVQVISAAGNHIIAVANPALVMSPTMQEAALSLKRESSSPDL